MKTNLSSCCNAEVDYMQKGDTVACGHCDDRFKEGLKLCENSIPNFKCDCRCHLASTEVIETNKEWESEFDKVFPLGLEEPDEKKWDTYYEKTQEVKDFIHNLISTKEKELKEKIESKRKYHKEFECNGANGGKGCYETFCEDQNCRNAPKEYNQAVDDILEIINKE